jgi:phospholipase/carboxylesterase/glyoxalase family protein
MSIKQLGFIHTFIPAQESGSAFTLLLLHGTGGNEKDPLSLGEKLAPGAALLSPRGKVLENGVPRFFRRLAEGVFDIEDLILRTNELADFVEAASALYRFDLSKAVAVGYSNGANIAVSMLLLRPRLLAGAILFRPMVPLVPEMLPELSETPVFISAGLLDSIVSQEQTERLVDLLLSCDSDVTLHWQNRGHDLSAQEVGEAKEWLSKWIARSA